MSVPIGPIGQVVTIFAACLDQQDALGGVDTQAVGLQANGCSAANDGVVNRSFAYAAS